MGKNILTLISHKSAIHLAPIFFLAFVTIVNYWLVPIFRINIFYGILFITLSFLLFAVSSNLFEGVKKILIVILGIVFALLSILLLTHHFDDTLKKVTPTENYKQRQRHGLYAKGLGVIFTNKFSLIYYKNWSLPVEKNLRNISYSLDPNLYFFVSHPREKSGIDEIEKYSPTLLPFFLLGLLSYFVNLSEKKWLSIYLIASIAVTSFLSPYFILGPVLLFPFMNVVIANGCYLVFKVFLEKEKKP